MALTAKHNETLFGVGDQIKVFQKIKEGEKFRTQVFEGVVIGIKGREENRSFTVRRIGSQQIGIERIFPLFSPTIEKVQVMKEGTSGVRRAKLYYIRHKSKKEIDAIYSRIANKDIKIKSKPKKSPKKSKVSKK